MNVKAFKALLLPFVFILAMTFTQSNDAAAAYSREQLKTYAVQKVNTKDLECLAKNIYFEARGEPKRGQVAVARVVMNRVNHGFADSPCEVVYQKTRTPTRGLLCQFSWVCEGKRKLDKTDPAYIAAKDIAYRVLVHDAYRHEVSKRTLFFHSTKVNPNWRYRRVERIGNHIFYEKI